MSSHESSAATKRPFKFARGKQVIYLGWVAISWGWRWKFLWKVGHSHSSYRLCFLGVMIEVVL